MSAFGGKADIPVFLSAISLRQCASTRRRITQPALRIGSRIGGGLPVALDNQHLHVVWRDATLVDF
jgi:hypothetical protein